MNKLPMIIVLMLVLFVPLACSNQQVTEMAGGTLTRVGPTQGSDFLWPYYLYIPDGVAATASEGNKVYLMVMPNDTGVASNGFMVHEQAAVKAMSRKATTAMLQDIGVVGMMPVFPRPEDQSFIYTHALDRDSLETKLAALHRLDLQLITMVDDASERLAKQDITVESEVVIWGFSASGMFANRFTALHPQRVLAAVVGSPGGWPVAPVESWNDRSLPYPVGVADMDELVDEPFDAEDFAATPQFFYLGQEDITDTVLSEESYNDTARSIIMELFGPSPVERWGIAEEIYASAGVNATFRLYPGAGHMTTPEMYADITAFVQDVLQAE